MRKKTNRPRWAKPLKLFFAYSFLVLLIFTTVGSYVWFNALNAARDKIPQIESELSSLKVPPSQILSADNVVLYEENGQINDPVLLSDVPMDVRNAVLSAEDRRFYHHAGVDIWALARAVFVTAKDRKLSQGASTLTMQLAKLLSKNSQKTFARKLSDMALASEMENEWSRDHIFQLYLNHVFFGAGATGIKAAARTYFGKDLDQLTLGEAAMLARCVRRPSEENPFKNLAKAISNRNVVLKIMFDDGLITSDQYNSAINEKVHLVKYRHSGDSNVLAEPYLVAQVLKDLRRDHPDVHLADGGYKIYTTFNMKLQAKAESAVNQVLTDFAGDDVNSGATVILNRSGEIEAEVAGKDFHETQFNIVTQGKLQPGSSFKPFVYSTAIAEQNMGPDSMISNEKLAIYDRHTHKSYVPNNDDHSFGGEVTMRTALAQSINIPAVRTLMKTGISNVIAMAHDVFGFKSKLPAYPSLALGTCEVSPLEMASAYSVFFLNGDRFTPYCIEKIEDLDGTTVFSSTPRIYRNVLDSRVCETMDGLLRGVVEHGTGTAALDVDGSRGKTGTTNNNTDAWFCGYDKDYLTVAWTGNQTYSKRRKKFVRRPMSSKVFGGTVSIKIWVSLMNGAQQLDKENHLNPPADTTNSSATDPNALQKPETAASKDANVPPVLDANGNPIPKSAGDQSTAGATTSGTAGIYTSDTSGATGNTTGPASTSGAPADPNNPGNTDGTSPTLSSNSAAPDSKGPSPNSPGQSGSPTSGLAVPAGETRRRKSVHRKPVVQTVTVSVCADSGDLATDYCPEVVQRTFVKGHEPKSYCTIHHR